MNDEGINELINNIHTTKYKITMTNEGMINDGKKEWMDEWINYWINK